MAKGYLKVKVSTASGALPISNAVVLVKDSQGHIIYNLQTDVDGITKNISLNTKDASLSLNPNENSVPYTVYNVHVSAPNFTEAHINGIQIFDGIYSTLPVDIYPSSGLNDDSSSIISIDDNNLLSSTSSNSSDDYQPTNVLKDVIIPDKITVHLGRYNESATNVTIPFVDYIKNVASSEIYPTWPVNAIIANVHAQISFALNRVYTEWYPAQGYNFNITSLPANDQAYNHGRNIFTNVSLIVDEIFNIFIQREGHKEPYISQFCNGTTSTCAGLSQWGSVSLANKGYNPINILKYYYPDDIKLIKCYNIESIGPSFSGLLLREGSKGDDVLTLQTQLNRIRTDFPGIPEINNPNGSFLSDTTFAVKVFQSVFNLIPDGLVGRATWNVVSRVYVAITKLSELDSEGEIIGISSTPPTSVIKLNSKGTDVLRLQHILSYISLFRVEIPSILENSFFDARTKNSVIAFQSTYKLTIDGIVGPSTWKKLYSVYHNFKSTVDVPEPSTPDTLYPPYPGYVLKVGSKGPFVTSMQLLLNDIAKVYDDIPNLSTDGIFGNGTKASVVAFQSKFGLVVDGIVGLSTWNKIIEVHKYNGSFEPSVPYPNHILKVGSKGGDVMIMQEYLNVVSTVYPTIKRMVPDGIFGNVTKSSVISFQSKFSLVPDGIIGKMTWDKIVDERNMIVFNRKANITDFSSHTISNNQTSNYNINLLLMFLLFRKFGARR